MTDITPISPEQDAFGREVVWTMCCALRAVCDEGFADWQTLTSFFANLLLDQDNRHKMLKQLFDDTKVCARQRRRETN